MLIFELCVFRVLIDDSCVAPPKIPPTAPDGYSLKYASLITRDGARAPIKKFLDRDMEGSWQCDASDGSAVRIEANPFAEPRRIHHLIDKRVADFPPNCRKGDLTVEGMDEMRELGQAYFNYFVNTTNLLEDYMNPDALYLRSSYDESSYRSALSFLDGLYTPESQDELINLISGSESGDVLRPDPAYCGDIQTSYNNYITGDFQILLNNAKTELEALFTYLKIDPNSLNQPILEAACDYVVAYTCSGRTLPDELVNLAPKCAEYLQKMINAQYGTAGASYVVREILTRLELAVSGETTQKLSYFSGIPSTLVEILKLLGKTDSPVPPYRSHLLIEVFQKESTPYVRFVYNGEVITSIPNLEVVDQSFYNLGAFYEYVKPLVIGANSQSKICPDMP